MPVQLFLQLCNGALHTLPLGLLLLLKAADGSLLLLLCGSHLLLQCCQLTGMFGLYGCDIHLYGVDVTQRQHHYKMRELPWVGSKG